MRRPPGGEARRIEIARAQRLQRSSGGGRRGERAGRGPAGQPAEQADKAERVGDGAVAVGHGVERRIGPVQRVGGTGEGLRQAALTVADRGERGAGGEAGGAEREIERVDPGVGVGEPAGGLGGGHAGAQAVAHCIGGCGGAGVEPGERVGGVAQRDEQAGQRGIGQPGVRAGRRCLPDRRTWAARCRGGRRRFRPRCPARTGAAGPNRPPGRPAGCPQPSMRFPKLLISLGQHDRSAPIRARWIRHFGGFRRPGRTCSRTRENAGKRVPSDNPALRTENRRSSLAGMTNSADLDPAGVPQSGASTA